MRRAWVERLAAPGGGPGFDLDVFREVDDEIVEGFLVTEDTREPYPVIAGVAIVPPSMAEHLRAYGNVYRRTPMRDPRMGRFVLGRVGSGVDRVPFDVVVGHYRDLAVDPPEGYDTSPHPDDEALGCVLTALVDEDAPPAFALDVGCGVGRSSFVIRQHARCVLGLDASLAQVRRARNIAVTSEDFFLPGPREEGRKPTEIRLDLEALVRTGADFVAGSPDCLPIRDDAIDLVVLHDGASADGVAEARRVLASGGLLVWQPPLDVGLEPEASQGSFHGARVP